MNTLTLTVEDHVAVLTMDQPDSRVNTITHPFFDEMDKVIDTVEQNEDIHALILISAKKEHFNAGADISVFLNFSKPGDALAFSQTAGKLFHRLGSLPIPVIAAIHGSAIGIGFELALACDYRIATDHPSTRFNMPDVKLGLCPCAGGTQRIPAIAGLTDALPILLKGNNFYAHEALNIGLVDSLVYKFGLLDAAKNLIHTLSTRSGNPADAKRDASNGALTDKTSGLRSLLPGSGNPVARRMSMAQAEREINFRTRGLLPAPAAILNCVKYGLKHGIEAGLAFESQTFDELAMTQGSRLLVQGYASRQSARKNPSKESPVHIDRIGVYGAGLMGSGITSISIQNGFKVTLKDRDLPSAIAGQQTAWSDLEKLVRKQLITPFQRDRRMSGLLLTADNKAMAGIRLIIEAVFEDLSIKHKILREVEPLMHDEAIFATNTSAIPIYEIAKAATKPERVIGMHYFSPVQKMPLLEIIRSDKTSEQTVSTACEVGIRQKKYVIVVKDSPGFYVTRIIIPMLNEAMLLMEEGADIRIIDTAMKNFGFPVGPITLIDEAGIDVVAHVNETMQPLFQERGIRIPQALHVLHEAGFNGRKNKRGFYDYRTKNKLINEEVYSYFGGSGRKDFSLKEISERLTLVLINEAILCLQEDIIRDPRDGDIGATLGMGFPPFLGGPFRYVDLKGAKPVLDRLEYLRGLYGDRFRPAPALIDLIRGNKRFYP